LFQTAWAILLQKYNNTVDVVFGSVVSGRSSAIHGIENILGLFINTIPVRINTNHKQTFRELIKEVQEQALRSKTREYLPLSDIQSRSLLKENLIDHIIVFENYPIDEEVKNMSRWYKTGFRVKNFEAREQTNYDLNVIVLPGKNLAVSISYNSIVYNRETIKTAAAHFIQITKEITNNKDIEVSNIEILTRKEKHQLLVEFNDTKADYPKDKTIVDLFEEQVERIPDNIAVVIMKACLTYRELNNKSGQLGYVLKEKGVRPDMNPIVGIMAERSLEMIIGILGILKAGGVYLPIDPDHPEERIHYMVADSGLKILLSTCDLLEKVTIVNCQLLTVNCQWEQGTDFPAFPLPRFPSFHPSRLAYIIYTSGSTGSPKGVVVRHRSAVNQLTAIARKYPCDRPLHHIFLVSVAFDVSVKQVLLPLCTGGKLFLVPEKIKRDAAQLLNYLVLSRVDLLFIPVSLMEVLLHRVESEAYPAVCFKYIVLGGEAFSTQLYRRVREKISFQKLFNIYGPTETTISATIYECGNDETGTTVPIGKPLMNYQTWIQGIGFKLQPIGAAGELCISGEGLAAGYLNRPELTAEKFRVWRWHPQPVIENDRWPMINDRLYHTGDLVRWLPDGNIEFLGRIDRQVKIRGFRIELGEIENQLLNAPSIKEAVVIDKIDSTGNKCLSAYIVSDEAIELSKLKEMVSKNLPGYMIPSFITRMEKIPLTLNGKIDRRALPEPKIAGRDNYFSPRNEIEKILVAIWSDVLGIAKEVIGIDDNFFELEKGILCPLFRPKAIIFSPANGFKRHRLQYTFCSTNW
jgi:amino acid adenylation domain-containing protein